VLALQDKLAYGPTFQAALSSLYGGEAPAVTSAEAPQAAQASPASLGAPQAHPDDLNALIAEAGKDFADYQRLTAQGKLGEAGQKLDQLKIVIDKLNARRK
jgi:uncharacterized membrane protein (UPF0182 family)